MSEAMLAMVLDVEVDRHKREVAEGFAALKAKLPPEPKPNPMHYNSGLNDLNLQQYYLGTQNAGWPYYPLGSLQPTPDNNPYCFATAGNNGLGAIWGRGPSWF